MQILFWARISFSLLGTILELLEQELLIHPGFEEGSQSTTPGFRGKTASTSHARVYSCRPASHSVGFVPCVSSHWFTLDA